MSEHKQITLRIPENIYEALQDLSDKTGFSVKDLILLAVLHSSHKFLKQHK